MKLTREQVIEKMLFCKTPSEVEEARDVRDEWMAENPDDLGILDAGSSVERMAQGFGLPSGEERLALRALETAV